MFRTSPGMSVILNLHHGGIMHSNFLPETGFVRLPNIIGNAKADPPIPPIYPVSRSSWWAGVKSGRYPQPVKLGPRITAWRIEDIRALIERHSRG